MNKHLLRQILLASSLLTSSACSGGDDGGGGSVNGAPTISAAITPADPVFGVDDLVCGFTVSDPDGDTVTIGAITWTDEGVPFAGTTSTTVRADDTITGAQTLEAHTYVCSATYDDAHGHTGLVTSNALARRPDLFLSADDTLTAGTYAIRNVFVPVGVTLTIQGLVQIDAVGFDIEGTVNGVGRGYAAPASSTNGNGPGAGTTSGTSGSSGGGYGGAGGGGGYDSGDPITAGGAAYGNATSQTIEMGSSGASSSSSAGGAGGAALSVTADTIDVAGTIDVSGASAAQPGGGQGGGGGAGGGILLVGGTVSASGSLVAHGGAGSVGTSTANDDGGGGGGGRVKIFHQGALVGTPTINVAGGTGGVNGTALPGQPGSAGTQHVEQLP